MESGPIALEALDLFIAFRVSSGVYGGALDSLLFLRSLVIHLESLEDLCRTTDENWSLK